MNEIRISIILTDGKIRVQVALIYLPVNCLKCCCLKNSSINQSVLIAIANTGDIPVHHVEVGK